MAGPNAIRVDLRALLPVALLALIVLVIIVVQLCGTEKVKPLGDITPLAQATKAPTFTPGPSPTRGPADATATSVSQIGGAQRDQVRIVELGAVQTALESYKQDHDSYPDTKGSIQTLCVFKEFDQGCKLEEILNPIPRDPIGDPSTNGYWYTSDGQTYIVYAQREGTAAPECAEHPEHLKSFKSVMCVRSP